MSGRAINLLQIRSRLHRGVVLIVAKTKGVLNYLLQIEKSGDGRFVLLDVFL